MKKIIVIAALAVAAWFAYGQFGPNRGVYLDDGSPKTIFFATAKCGKGCDKMRSVLKKRVDNFEEFDAFDFGPGSELYESLGGTGYLPYIVMGKQRVTGHNPGGLVSAIAAELGPSHVKEKEAKALSRHFSRDGEPVIVMYATAWCGYCTKARQYFRQNRIPFVEFDIEKDHSARRDYNALMGSGTPLLYQGYSRISGFNVSRIESEFDL
jgi:glutaredoxin